METVLEPVTKRVLPKTRGGAARSETRAAADLILFANEDRIPN
jgi:hypothetical protein